jgi:hypothetical protein
LDILGLTIAKGVLVIDPLQDMTYGGEVPFVTPVGALRHELGHMLGLRHEHPWRGGVFDPSCAELPTEPAADTTGAQIGSKAYDRESVMHYPFNSVATRLCGGITTSSLNLSATDKADIQLLYGMTPALVAVITQPLNE